jgi:Putative zinc-finger
MNAIHREERTTGDHPVVIHPDRFALELHAVGDLDGTERADLEAHLEDCTSCRERLWRIRQELAMAKRAMPETLPVADFRQRRAREKGRTAAWITAAAGWAAAACVLLVWSPWRGGETLAPPPDEDTIGAATRAKGTFGISVMRGRGEAMDRLGAVALCREGDRLQFDPDLPDHGYLQIVNVQDDGQIQAYLPSTPAAEASQRLEFSVELDDYVGRERIFFVWSPEPVEAGAVRSGLLESLALRPIEEVDEVPLPSGVVAEQHSVLIYKETSP